MNIKSTLNSVMAFISENRYPLMLLTALAAAKLAQADNTIFSPGDTCDPEHEILIRDQCGGMCKYYMDNLQWLASHGNSIATNVLEYCASTGFNFLTQSVYSDCIPSDADENTKMDFNLGLLIPRECRAS